MNPLTPLALRVFERNLIPVRGEEEAKELVERLCVPARLVEDSEFYCRNLGKACNISGQ